MQYDIRAQDRVAEHGEGFLMWLLWTQRRATTHIPVQTPGEEWGVTFSDKIVLSDENGTVVVQEDEAWAAEETVKALEVGKSVDSATFNLTRLNQDTEMTWSFTMSADANLSAVTCPVVLGEEEDDKAMELIYLLDLVEQVVSGMFCAYLADLDADPGLKGKVVSSLARRDAVLTSSL
jgi:hypothetical protein